jgi:hypothetical protein
MRLIDIVLGCVLIGLIVGLVQIMRPADASADSVVRERITWLWTPALARRAGSVQ